MMFKRMWVFAIVMLAAPSLSFALGECKADREKFCADAGPSKKEIKQCIKAHYKDLSPVCKKKVDQMEAEKSGDDQ